MFIYNYFSAEYTTKIKKKGIEFSVLKPKAFQKLAQEANENDKKISLVRTTEFKKCNPEYEYALSIRGEMFSTEPISSSAVKYYIPIKSDNPNEFCFITVEKSSLIPLFLLIVFLLSLLLSLGTAFHRLKTTIDADDFEIEEGQDITEKQHVVEQAELEYTKFPGYADLELSEKQPYVYLTNPAGNTVYMKYSIYDEQDVLLYETKPIAVGKEVQVDFTAFLDKGTHNLTFVQSTFDVDTKAECNGTTSSVKVNIK